MIYGSIGVVSLLLLVMLNPFVVIPPGHVGVMNTFGKIENNKGLREGLHFRLPWQGVDMVSYRLSTHVDQNVASASRDLQTVRTEVTIPFSINPDEAPELFRKIGNRDALEACIMSPGVLESLKAVTARYTAEELITKRDIVKAGVEEHVMNYVSRSLKEKGLEGAVVIGNVALTHFEFSKEFNEAIEAKVKAEQDALRAENQNKQKITEAEATAASTQLQASAAAFSTRVRAEAEARAISLRANALMLNPKLVELNAVEKWNGILPTMTGSSPIPFINIK